MRAAICSIGSEILLGDQTDTNATWLSAQFASLGIEVLHHVAAGDDMDALVAALRWLADRVDVLVTGGGLGPTPDDLTREAVATLAGVELRTDPDLEEALIQGFAERGYRMPASNLKQALVPVGARALPPKGTAPGLQLDVDRADGGVCTVVCLPGVPWEMRDMFDESVVGLLRERSGGAITLTRSVHVLGMMEATVAETVGGLLDEACAATPRLAWSILAHHGEIEVRLTASASDRDAAMAMTDPLVEQVRDRLGASVVALDDETLEAAIVRDLTEAGVTVAFAESATSGGIAARLGAVPGASAVLAGGIVAYATSSKVDVLGVDADLLAAHGPVSAEVTDAMAAAVRERFGATFGVAVTGAAGPDPQDGQEPGTVFWAVADDTGVEGGGRWIAGDRTMVQARLGSAALEALRRAASERQRDGDA